eukprot:gene7295-5137_t
MASLPLHTPYYQIMFHSPSCCVRILFFSSLLPFLLLAPIVASTHTNQFYNYIIPPPIPQESCAEHQLNRSSRLSSHTLPSSRERPSRLGLGWRLTLSARGLIHPTPLPSGAAANSPERQTREKEPAMGKSTHYHHPLETRLSSLLSTTTTTTTDATAGPASRRCRSPRTRRSLSVKFRLPDEVEPSRHSLSPSPPRPAAASRLSSRAKPSAARDAVAKWRDASSSAASSSLPAPSPSPSPSVSPSGDRSSSRRDAAPWRAFKERLESLDALGDQRSASSMRDPTPAAPGPSGDRMLPAERSTSRRPPRPAPVSHPDPGPSAEEAYSMWMVYYQQYCEWYRHQQGTAPPEVEVEQGVLAGVPAPTPSMGIEMKLLAPPVAPRGASQRRAAAADTFFQRHEQTAGSAGREERENAVDLGTILTELQDVRREISELAASQESAHTGAGAGRRRTPTLSQPSPSPGPGPGERFGLPYFPRSEFETSGRDDQRLPRRAGSFTACTPRHPKVRHGHSASPWCSWDDLPACWEPTRGEPQRHSRGGNSASSASSASGRHSEPSARAAAGFDTRRGQRRKAHISYSHYSQTNESLPPTYQTHGCPFFFLFLCILASLSYLPLDIIFLFLGSRCNVIRKND